VGTDTRSTFGGIAHLTGVTDYGSSGCYVNLTFTGLDPAKDYTFATSAARCESTSNRLTIFTPTGPDIYVNASTSGVDVLVPNSVRFDTGDNYSAGYVARRTGITAADGIFKVRTEADPASDSGYKAYALDMFMLQE